MALPVNAVLVMNHQFTGSGNHDVAAVITLHRAHADPGHCALVPDLDTARRRNSRGGTTNMEGAHGQLCSRLADALRSHHTHSLTTADEVTPGKIAPIAGGTDPVPCLTGHGRPDFEVIHVVFFQQVHPRLINHLPSTKELRPVTRAHDVFGDGAAENAVLQRDDYLTALNNRFAQDAVGGLAVFFGDDKILANIHQPSCQITRVGRFQRRVGQTLAGAVRRNEVLIDVKAFAEVGGNRGFDDGSVRLGHQAAHPRQLTNLGVAAPGTGVRHHVDGVEGFLLNRFALGIDYVLNAEFVHHFTSHPVTGMGPDIDDLVVAFTVGKQALPVLFLDGFHLHLRRIKRRGLAVRDDHVVDADRHAGFGRHRKPGVHQLVTEDHCIFQAHPTVRLVNHR